MNAAGIRRSEDELRGLEDAESPSTEATFDGKAYVLGSTEHHELNKDLIRRSSIRIPRLPAGFWLPLRVHWSLKPWAKIAAGCPAPSFAESSANLREEPARRDKAAPR